VWLNLAAILGVLSDNPASVSFLEHFCLQLFRPKFYTRTHPDRLFDIAEAATDKDIKCMVLCRWCAGRRMKDAKKRKKQNSAGVSSTGGQAVSTFFIFLWPASPISRSQKKSLMWASSRFGRSLKIQEAPDKENSVLKMINGNLVKDDRHSTAICGRIFASTLCCPSTAQWSGSMSPSPTLFTRLGTEQSHAAQCSSSLKSSSAAPIF
jgi:hypothetical protein